MNSGSLRASGRSADQIRPITITPHLFGYAAGSILFEQGNTKVLCAVTMSPGVPGFMKGTRSGWLTAEYAMLPTSTQTRSVRETSKRNDRAIEISRLIGRSLRCIVDLSALGERTIFVDCDVLQADGSTRTAAITGAFFALKLAQTRWLENGLITKEILQDEIAAVSAGISKSRVLLDLDYQEDASIESDYNFILTRSEKIIEIQGTAEKNPLSWNQFDLLKKNALDGIKAIFVILDDYHIKSKISDASSRVTSEHVPLFSLKNRLANTLQ